MPELDCVRGIAVLLVLLFHGFQQPPGRGLSRADIFLLSAANFGWTGVNLFFVLSGLLITGILLDSRNRDNYFSAFYKRRTLRILPALFATLLALQLSHWAPWAFTALSAIFLANCAPLFGVPLQYAPLWSLAVEEHFYLFWPALVRRLSARALAGILLGICLLTPVLRMAGLPRHPVFDSFFTWFELDGLAMGGLLAVWLRSAWFNRKRMVVFATLSGLLGVTGFFALLQPSLPQIALQTTMCNLGAAGLISGMLLLGTSRWHMLVHRPFLKFCGYISYGLYLIHMLMFKASELLLSPFSQRLQLKLGAMGALLLQFLLGAMLAIVVAYLSRRSLEEFFLRRATSSQGSALRAKWQPARA